MPRLRSLFACECVKVREHVRATGCAGRARQADGVISAGGGLPDVAVDAVTVQALEYRSNITHRDSMRRPAHGAATFGVLCGTHDTPPSVIRRSIGACRRWRPA